VNCGPYLCSGSGPIREAGCKRTCVGWRIDGRLSRASRWHQAISGQCAFPTLAELEMSIGDYGPELAYNLYGIVAFDRKLAPTMPSAAGPMLLSPER
jgi:hypothetical protein